jgi:hypothetical protein
LFTGVSSDKSPGDSLLFKQSALRGVSYALTGYAPELNPDEMVWNYMKRTGTARKPLAKEESLQDRIDVELQQIQQNRALVRSFFRAETVSYISD